MKRSLAAATCLASMLALGMVASAQTTGQPPAQSPAQATASQDQQVTIAGCVQRESDYRREHNLGRGGAVGTGVGGGNEFVLVNASMSPSASSTPPATGTSGTAGDTSAMKGDAYELTGSGEGQLEQHLGKRVEIVGKLKPAEVGTTGPTGGTTAGAPPAGVDVTSPDLKLRELEVISVREVAGTCPTK